MTNQDEVAELKRVQEKEGLSVIEAIYKRADMLKKPRSQKNRNDEVFL